MPRMFKIVEYSSDMYDEVVHRFPEAGEGTYYIGTTLIVNPNQNAFFSIHGTVLDKFGSGKHAVSSLSIPLLIEFLGDEFNDRVPFVANVHFVRITSFNDISWNTPAAFLVGSPRTGNAFVQAQGKYSFVISDSRKFLQQFALPTEGGLKTMVVQDRIRDIMIPNIQNTVAYYCNISSQSLLEILSYRKNGIEEMAVDATNEECSSLGITIKTFSLDGINLAKNNNELLRAWAITQESEKIRSVEEVDPKFIFVISAFQDDMELVYLSIETAATKLGLNAKRVKDFPGDYRITDRIIEMIHKARFIVADLTHERPNVYFELGYARGLGKTVVTLARDGTNVHFDVKDWTYISYTDLKVLQNELEKRFEFEISNDEFS